MMSNSKKVVSSQNGLHPDLKHVVEKHLCTTYQKPVRVQTEKEIAQLLNILKRKPLILDSGCGVGESSRHIAAQYPESTVLAVDKSSYRLHKTSCIEVPKNVYYIRADICDVWKLFLSSDIRVQKHYLLYPNPWPKKKDLKKRWHGHPAFRMCLDLGGELELRTNFKIYAEEFAEALGFSEKATHISLSSFVPKKCITPFERKYFRSKHELYKLTAFLGS